MVGVGVGARPAQGAATTTDEGLVRTLERASLVLGCVVGVGVVRGRHKARPLQLIRFGADARTSVPTGRMCGWCEAGTRRGHYN